MERIDYAKLLVLHEGHHDERGDREVFDALARRMLNASIASDTHPIVKAYRFFKFQVADKFGSHLSSVSSFLNHVGENVTFLEVRLSRGDDAKRMFERLNARGRQVTASRLLENLLSFQDQSRNDAIAREAVQLLNDLQNSFSERDLRTFLALLPKRLALDTPQNADYARFKVYRDDAEQREELQQWLVQIRRCRDIYEMVIDGTPHHTAFNSFHYFAPPALLPAVVRMVEVFGDRSPELHLLECFTIRRFFCEQRPSHAFAALSSRLCGALAEFGRPNKDRASFRKAVFEILAEADVSDAEFTQHFAEKPLYGNGQKRGQARYILERLENRLNEHVPGTISFHSGCSIEHVFPQKPGEGWPEYGAINNASVRRWLHTVGNLTVLLIPDNSRFSNLAYTRKRPFYLDPAKAVAADPDLGLGSVPGNLQLNHTFNAFPEWDVSAIQARGADLARIACNIWPAITAQRALIL